MGKDFTAAITNPERAAEWKALLGTTTVYIKSPIPKRANLPDHSNILIYELVYKLDLDLTTDEHRQLLIRHFHLIGVPKKMIIEALEEIGVPSPLQDSCRRYERAVEQEGTPLHLIPHQMSFEELQLT